MPKGFCFSFGNDFQRLCVDAVFCDDAVRYCVSESVNVDFVPKTQGFVPFQGDAAEWIARFSLLDFGKWGSGEVSGSSDAGGSCGGCGSGDASGSRGGCDSRGDCGSSGGYGSSGTCDSCAACPTCEADMSEGDTCWSFVLFDESSEGGARTFSGDEGSYPKDFVSFLGLLKELLDVPVLLLEL